MPQITVSKSAVEKITGDPKFRASREDEHAHVVPLLYYYRRSYSTLKDGTNVEHGDGFMLSFVNPQEIKDTKDIAYQTVNLAEDVNILVGAPPSILSHNFSIGRSNAKFTFEPQTHS